MKNISQMVLVLGHPGYYPRYGFIAAGALAFEAPDSIPEEVAGAWMVQELSPGVIESVSGKVHCAKTLNRPEYWRE
jgi:putative acetyltransferase